jgi:serine/threonine protein kinase
LNEARAINKLRTKPSDNLVSVIKHGWFPDSTTYFIDMELCEANLERYIQDPTPMLYDQLSNPRLLNIPPSANRGFLKTWDIMEQIASGLEVIHSANEVHRDLKPRNSTIYPNY